MAKFDETVSDPNLRGLGASSGSGGNSGVTAQAVETLGEVGLAIASHVGGRRNERKLKEHYEEGQEIINEPVEDSAAVEPMTIPTPKELVAISRDEELSAEFAQKIRNIDTSRTMGAREKRVRLRQLRDRWLNDNWHLRDELNLRYREQIGEIDAIEKATASNLTAAEQRLLVAERKAAEAGVSVERWLHSQSVKAMRETGAWKFKEGGKLAEVIGEDMTATATDIIIAMNGEFNQGGIPDLFEAKQSFEEHWESTRDVREAILRDYPEAGRIGLEYAEEAKKDGLASIERQWVFRTELPSKEASYLEDNLKNSGIKAITRHLPELATLVVDEEDPAQAAIAFAGLLLGPKATQQSTGTAGQGTSAHTYQAGIRHLDELIAAQRQEPVVYQAGAPKATYDLEDLMAARAMLVAQQENVTAKVVEFFRDNKTEMGEEEFNGKLQQALVASYKNFRGDVKARMTQFLMEMNMVTPVTGWEAVIDSIEDPKEGEQEVITDIGEGSVSDRNLTEALVNFPSIRSSMQDPEFQKKVDDRTRFSFAVLTQGLQNEELNPDGVTWDDFEIVRYPREDMQGGMTRRAMPPGGFIDIRLKDQGEEPSGERIPIGPGRTIPEMRKKKRLDRSLERALRQLTIQVNTALFWHEDVESAVGGFPEGVAVDDSAMKLDADGVQGLEVAVQELEQTEAKDEILAKQGNKRAADRLTLLNNYRSRLAGQEERVRRYNPDTGRIE
jgi:hypothetical protein